MTEKPRIASKFSRHLFSKDYWFNNTELRDISTRIICMTIPIWLESYGKLKIKNTYIPRLFDKPSLFTKIKLKWPLSRDSHFNIYFHLECQGNWGLRQNFYRILFSKYRILINSDHFVTYDFYSKTYFALVVKHLDMDGTTWKWTFNQFVPKMHLIR